MVNAIVGGLACLTVTVSGTGRITRFETLRTLSFVSLCVDSCVIRFFMFCILFRVYLQCDHLSLDLVPFDL